MVEVGPTTYGKSSFWVVRCNSIVGSMIGKYFKSRLLRGKLEEQKITGLPNDRKFDRPPFRNSGVNMFWQFLINEKGKVERYSRDMWHSSHVWLAGQYMLNVHATWIQIHSCKVCVNL